MEIINIELDFRGKETYFLNEPTRKLLTKMKRLAIRAFIAAVAALILELLKWLKVF